MRELYPAISPNHHFMMKVDDTHNIYVEESGTEDGIPVVYLHGGPGSGSMPYHRQLFDPEKYRIILFDQRGCGNSTPHASLKNNTTQDLIADMEQIREALNIKCWVVAGGSWGSTLSLAYAQAHPNRVLGLIVRGIFLGTKPEFDWYYQFGASQFFPDYWEDFVAPIPEAERGDILTAYHKQLTGSNELARMRAAKAWSTWEGRTANLNPTPLLMDHFTAAREALAISRIEAHYFMNNCFFEDNELLNRMGVLQNIPGYIVHGRYDMICQLKQAYDLHQAWPIADFSIVPSSGHAANEPGIVNALVNASDDMVRKLK